jgi:hypothetical protein
MAVKARKSGCRANEVILAKADGRRNDEGAIKKGNAPAVLLVRESRPTGDIMTTRRKKKTTIITETDRLLILNRHSGAVEGWCEDLEGLVGIVQPGRAEGLAAFRLGSVYGSLDPNRLERNDDGVFQVCLDSLLKPA